MAVTLADMTRWYHQGTGSPVGAAALGSLGLSALGYYALPKAVGALGYMPGDLSEEELAGAKKRTARLGAIGGSVVGAAIPLLSNYDKGAPDYGMLHYPENKNLAKVSSALLRKCASMESSINSMQTIPMYKADFYINTSSQLDPLVKSTASAALNALDLHPVAQVGADDILNGAIKLGISVAGGSAIGYLASKALGLSTGLPGAILGGLTFGAIHEL